MKPSNKVEYSAAIASRFLQEESSHDVRNGRLTTVRTSACSDLQALFADCPNLETDKKQQDRTSERELELTSIASILS